MICSYGKSSKKVGASQNGLIDGAISAMNELKKLKRTKISNQLYLEVHWVELLQFIPLSHSSKSIIWILAGL